MRNNINRVLKGICGVFGAVALVSTSVAGCGKKTEEEKMLSNMEDDIEEVEIEEDIKAETFEKDGITYKKISGTNLCITYPVLEGAKYNKKVNDALINNRKYNGGYGGSKTIKDDNSDVSIVNYTVGIEPFYFDKSHSELLSSSQDVSYITYRLYNVRAYLYSSLYGCNAAGKEGIIPRDETVLGLSKPTEPIPNDIRRGKFLNIESSPVSLIDTDFNCGYIFKKSDGSLYDHNVYLAIEFVFEEYTNNCSDVSKMRSMVAEEISKAILEAEIHYKSGEIEKKYVGFKAYNNVNPEYYDVYTVNIE